MTATIEKPGIKANQQEQQPSAQVENNINLAEQELFSNVPTSSIERQDLISFVDQQIAAIIAVENEPQKSNNENSGLLSGIGNTIKSIGHNFRASWSGGGMGGIGRRLSVESKLGTSSIKNAISRNIETAAKNKNSEFTLDKVFTAIQEHVNKCLPDEKYSDHKADILEDLRKDLVLHAQRVQEAKEEKQSEPIIDLANARQSARDVRKKLGLMVANTVMAATGQWPVYGLVRGITNRIVSGDAAVKTEQAKLAKEQMEKNSETIATSLSGLNNLLQNVATENGKAIYGLDVIKIKNVLAKVNAEAKLSPEASRQIVETYKALRNLEKQKKVISDSGNTEEISSSLTPINDLYVGNQNLEEKALNDVKDQAKKIAEKWSWARTAFMGVGMITTTKFAMDNNHYPFNGDSADSVVVAKDGFETGIDSSTTGSVTTLDSNLAGTTTRLGNTIETGVGGSVEGNLATGFGGQLDSGISTEALTQAVANAAEQTENTVIDGVEVVEEGLKNIRQRLAEGFDHWGATEDTFVNVEDVAKGQEVLRQSLASVGVQEDPALITAIDMEFHNAVTQPGYKVDFTKVFADSYGITEEDATQKFGGIINVYDKMGSGAKMEEITAAIDEARKHWQGVGDNFGEALEGSTNNNLTKDAFAGIFDSGLYGAEEQSDALATRLSFWTGDVSNVDAKGLNELLVDLHNNTTNNGGGITEILPTFKEALDASAVDGNLDDLQTNLAIELAKIEGISTEEAQTIAGNVVSENRDFINGLGAQIKTYLESTGQIAVSLPIQPGSNPTTATTPDWTDNLATGAKYAGAGGLIGAGTGAAVSAGKGGDIRQGAGKGFLFGAGLGLGGGVLAGAAGVAIGGLGGGFLAGQGKKQEQAVNRPNNQPSPDGQPPQNVEKNPANNENSNNFEQKLNSVVDNNLFKDNVENAKDAVQVVSELNKQKKIEKIVVELYPQIALLAPLTPEAQSKFNILIKDITNALEEEYKNNTKLTELLSKPVRDGIVGDKIQKEIRDGLKKIMTNYKRLIEDAVKEIAIANLPLEQREATLNLRNISSRFNTPRYKEAYNQALLEIVSKTTDITTLKTLSSTAIATLIGKIFDNVSDAEKKSNISAIVYKNFQAGLDNLLKQQIIDGDSTITIKDYINNKDIREQNGDAYRQMVVYVATTCLDLATNKQSIQEIANAVKIEPAAPAPAPAPLPLTTSARGENGGEPNAEKKVREEKEKLSTVLNTEYNIDGKQIALKQLLANLQDPTPGSKEEGLMHKVLDLYNDYLIKNPEKPGEKTPKDAYPTISNFKNWIKIAIAEEGDIMARLRNASFFANYVNQAVKVEGPRVIKIEDGDEEQTQTAEGAEKKVEPVSKFDKLISDLQKAEENKVGISKLNSNVTDLMEEWGSSSESDKQYAAFERYADALKANCITNEEAFEIVKNIVPDEPREFLSRVMNRRDDIEGWDDRTSAGDVRRQIGEKILVNMEKLNNEINTAQTEAIETINGISTQEIKTKIINIISRMEPDYTAFSEQIKGKLNPSDISKLLQIVNDPESLKTQLTSQNLAIITNIVLPALEAKNAETATIVQENTEIQEEEAEKIKKKEINGVIEISLSDSKDILKLTNITHKARNPYNEYAKDGTNEKETNAFKENTTREGEIDQARLLKLGLEPKYKFNLPNGLEIAVSSKPYKLNDGRIVVPVYVKEIGGSYSLRNYVPSNSSAGLFRYYPDTSVQVNADGSEKITWFNKAFGEESLQLPSNIQKQVYSIINQGDFVDLNSQGISPDYVFTRTSRVSIYSEDNGYQYLPPSQSNTVTLKVEKTGQEISGDFYKKLSSSTKPEKLEITKEGEKPDFNNIINKWTANLPLYGETNYYQISSKDGKIAYTFAHSPEGDIVQIPGGEIIETNPTSTGLNAKWLKLGLLSTPGYEYPSQTGGQGDIGEYKEGYRKMKGFLDKMPIIKQFRKEVLNQNETSSKRSLGAFDPNAVGAGTVVV